MCGVTKRNMKEVLWVRIGFLRHLLKSCIRNIKADREDAVSLYDSVDQAIPCRVAPQHCPTLFHLVQQGK